MRSVVGRRFDVDRPCYVEWGWVVARGGGEPVTGGVGTRWVIVCVGARVRGRVDGPAGYQCERGGACGPVGRAGLSWVSVG